MKTKNEQKVLIVEDDQSSYLYLKEILSRRNITIFRVNNGEDAIKYVTEHDDIDLILMDIKLYNMSGIEATKKIRNNKINIPIIIQTACAYEPDRLLSFKAGANDFITKPIDCKELLFLARKYINI